MITLNRFRYGCKNGCSNLCNSLTHSLANLFYQYFLGKTEIINDKKNILSDIFDMLNFKVMEQGNVAVILNYGNGLTISEIKEVWYDKNYQPICATVNINGPNNIQTFCKIADWKLFLSNNNILKQKLFQNIGFGFDELKNPNNEDIYKAIFFKNNFLYEPSLQYVGKILSDLHCLDEKNDLNHELLGLIYSLTSANGYNEEQLENFGFVISKDGRGIALTTLNNNSDTSEIKKEFIINDFSKWPGIKDERMYLIDLFFDFTGIPKEKISEQRENIPETKSRNARVSVLEKQYYKYRKKFVDELNNFYNYKDEDKIKIEFDTTVPQYLENGETYNNEGVNNESNQN